MVNEETIQLIISMLRYEPMDRIYASDLMKHKYFDEVREGFWWYSVVSVAEKMWSFWECVLVVPLRGAAFFKF